MLLLHELIVHVLCIEDISQVLNVSKVKRDEFRFIGRDIEKYQDQIKVLMQDYSYCLEEILDIRKANRKEKLSSSEMKIYRNAIGKLS